MEGVTKLLFHKLLIGQHSAYQLTFRPHNKHAVAGLHEVGKTGSIHDTQ